MPKPFDLPLRQSTVLDGSGNGFVTIQAQRGDLVIKYTTVTVSTANSQPVATVYRGAQNGTVLDATYTGANDTSDTRIVLRQGEQLFVVWVGGDPGATATATFACVQYDPDTAPVE